jgi:hypothetical protein
MHGLRMVAAKAGLNRERCGARAMTRCRGHRTDPFSALEIAAVHLYLTEESEMDYKDENQREQTLV